jgi:hypothetical protein
MHFYRKSAASLGPKTFISPPVDFWLEATLGKETACENGSFFGPELTDRPSFGEVTEENRSMPPLSSKGNCSKRNFQQQDRVSWNFDRRG